MAVALVGISCKDKASNKIVADNVETATTRDDAQKKVPVMSFEKAEHDFGTIEQGTPQETIFKFTNTGDAPLIITDAKSSCGCTVPKWSKDPILPGKTGEIQVKYDTNRVNPIRKTITVISNADTPTVALKIKGEVIDSNKESVLEKKGKNVVEQ